MEESGSQNIPESAGNGTGRLGKYIRAAAPWAVSAGIIVYIIVTEDMRAVVGSFKRGNIEVYLGTTIPFLVFLLFIESLFLLWGFRWFARVGRFGELLRARAATYLLTIISIFIGLGGLVFYGKRKYGIPYSLGTTIMLNELLHELASQCTLALMVGLILPVYLVPDNALSQVQGVMLAGMIGVGFYALCIIISRLSRYLPESFPKVKVLDPFVHLPLWQYGVFYLVKLVQNVIYGVFLAGLFLSFGMNPPLIVNLAFMQIIHLTRAIPISAFGIGVDQIAIPVLYRAWEPPEAPGLLLALSIVFTFTLIFGRALLGLPFVRGVYKDLVTKEPENKSDE